MSLLRKQKAGIKKNKNLKSLLNNFITTFIHFHEVLYKIRTIPAAA